MSKMTEEEFLRSPLKHAFDVMRGHAIDYRDAWQMLKQRMIEKCDYCYPHTTAKAEEVLADMKDIENLLHPMTQAEAEKAYEEAPNVPLLESEKEEIIQRVMNSPEALRTIGWKK